MAIPIAAQAAATAVAKYGPQVFDAARGALTRATSGRLTDPAQITNYVKASPERMAVVATALVGAGVPVNEIISSELSGKTEFLNNLRQRLVQIAGAMREEAVQRGSRAAPAPSIADTADDEVRIERVKAALAVFGSSDRYFLSAGLTSDDFAWYERMKRKF